MNEGEAIGELMLAQFDGFTPARDALAAVRRRASAQR